MGEADARGDMCWQGRQGATERVGTLCTRWLAHRVKGLNQATGFWVQPDAAWQLSRVSPGPTFLPGSRV
eukprot:365907-Chlamydomonas_euryale.AAC.20